MDQALTVLEAASGTNDAEFMKAMNNRIGAAMKLMNDNPTRKT